VSEVVSEETGTAVAPAGMQLGEVALLTFADGRAGTWPVIRLQDGIALCADPLPADFPAAVPMPLPVRERLLAWATGKVRLWVMVLEAEPEWVCARWQPGAGEPEPYEATDALTGDHGDAVLDLVGAVVQMAAQVFPAWSQYTVTAPVVVTVLPVFRHPGFDEAPDSGDDA